MNDTPSAGRYYLEHARKALKRKDIGQTRYWADLAARTIPHQEEPWLILAAVSEPDDSVLYLKRALEINPTSQRARQGMHWAIRRLRAVHPPTPSPVTAGDRQPESASRALEDTAPIRVRSAKAGVKKRASWLRVLLPAFIVILFLTFSLTFLIGLRPEWIVSAGNSSAPRPVGILEKPSLTPSATATPTATATATATLTSTPTHTATATPTVTQTATFTPEPTATDVPTAAPASVDLSGRWIDVDLTNQMVYAYEGDTIVNSFLVSTGRSRTPTVTGQYRIYVKYTADDMAGPGYFLPDVPYVMYFYRGYGFHGTYWHDNFGTPMSHGCINLRTSDAEWLFHWASVGTLVNIRY